MVEAAAYVHGRQLARYTLLEKLGEGGQGEVWRANDDTGGIDVALKVLNPTYTRIEGAWAALEREHSIASRLAHPAILKVFPPQRTGDLMVLPMELASGGDLRRLRGAGYLEIIPVLLEVAQALEHAHERGVIHRDLKPGNVLFDARGRVKLADFGVAGTVFASGPEPSGPGLSPFSASPEQLRGEPPTPADDIYGLGALAYELLSGYPPHYPHFDAKRVQEEPAPELTPTRQIPSVLGKLVMRMLAKDPRARPRSMREVIDELDAGLNDTLPFELEPSAAASSASATASKDAGEASATPDAARASPAHGRTPEVGSTDQERGSSEAGSTDLTAASGVWWVDAPGAPAASSGGRTAPPNARAAATPDDWRPPPGAATAGATDGRLPPSAGVTAGPTPHGRAAASASLMAAAMPDVRVPPARGPAAAATDRAPHRGGAAAANERLPWDHLKLESVPRTARLEPIKARRRWPFLVLGLLAGAAFAVFYWLPRYGLETFPMDPFALSGTRPRSSAGSSTSSTSGPAAEPVGDTAAEEKLQASREEFDRRLAALEPRGAGVWGGVDFATAKSRAAESVGAHDAGNTPLAQARLSEALRLLERVETNAPQALTAQIDAGNKALAAGQEELASQAFNLAKRIAPDDKRVAEGLRRAHSLSGVLPLLAEAANAESASDYSRAAQDYSRALALDPGNARARSGLERAKAAFSDDSYARAVGTGFAALGAGRLEEARTDFERARTFRPNGSEAAQGLKRVNAALTASGYASTRQRAAGLEALERWDEAVQAYESALQADPSLEFAQQGKARATARAALAKSLQALIDRPERLAAPSVREQARLLLQSARTQSPSGPVLRSQIARVEAMLPEFDKTVRLSLVSDNATQVAIPSIGSFGTFAKREIELKPGKYTVIGTRNGYRDVRREITVAPGQDNQTISVTCSEPI